MTVTCGGCAHRGSLKRKAKSSNLPQRPGRKSGAWQPPDLAVLRKPTVVQQMNGCRVFGDSCVAKRYCINDSIGDTFVQC